MNRIKIDLNNPALQNDLFNLEKHEQLAFIKTLRKISNLGWNELYKDKRIRWEVIISKTTKNMNRIYSFRFSQKYIALAIREELYLRILSLHRDHDSAYK